MSEFARNLAIVIGINQYDGGIAPLQTAANDATVLAQILKEKHNYQVRLWVNEQATLTNLNRLFEELLPKTVTEGDRLLFYFAGHGIALNGEDGPEGYLIPQGARLGNVESYLPMSELNAALAKLTCRHFLAVLDCCFAGAFRWSSNRDVSTVPEVIHKERYDRFIQDPAWQVITSAAHDQKALDILTLRDRTGSTGKHSPFAAALMDALSGAADSSPPARNGEPAGDGVITATELYLYLRDEVERNTENSTKRQTPGLWCLKNHDKGEYIFLTPEHELNLPPAPPLDVSKNPYRGLASFEEEHSNLFFGRSVLTKKLQEFVIQHPLTVVLGASGSGKSSLVKAGLIPYLKLLNQEQEIWQILDPIRPGESPLAALKATRIELDERILVSSITNWANQHPNGKLLLVIDQFEELVTLCRDEIEQKQFLNLLAHILNSCSDQIHILLTLRSDFEPQFRDTPLEVHWNNARFIVPAMNREELREAIEEPASLVVMHFEPYNLVEQLIDEVAQMPGVLPLLSFALSELYLKYLQRQDRARNRGEAIDRSMTKADYDALGGITRSLTQRADQEYEALVRRNPVYEQVVRDVMLRMITVGEGDATRRRVPLYELEYSGGKNEKAKEVINRFVDARLLVRSINAEDQSCIEPAHDVLVQGWQRLVVWKKQEQENLLLQRRLTPAAMEWKTHQQARFLWNADARLDLLKQIHSSKENWFNRDEANFVDSSIRRKQRNVRLRWFSLSSLLAIAIIVAITLNGLRQTAYARQQESLLRQISAQAQVVQNENDNLLEASVLLATEAKQLGLKLGLYPLQADQALRQGLVLLPHPLIYNELPVNPQNNYYDSVFTKDSKYLITANGTVLVTEIPSGKEIARFSYDQKTILSPNGQYFAVFTGNRSIDLTEVLNNRKVAQIDFAEDIQDIIFSANAHYLLVKGQQQIQVWKIDTQRNTAFNIYSLPVNNSLPTETYWSFSPDEQYLVEETEIAISLRDIQTKSSILNLPIEWNSTSPVVNSFIFSADGRYLAGPTSDGMQIQVWEIPSGKVHTKIDFHPFAMTSIALSSRGKYLAIGNRIGGVTVIDANSGEDVFYTDHNLEWVKFLAFSPKENYLAMGGGNSDQFTRIVEVPSGKEVTRVSTSIASWRISFSSDGRYAVGYNSSEESNHSFTVWKLGNNEEAVLEKNTIEAALTEVERQGDTSILAVYEGELRLDAEWRLKSVSPDNQYLAILSEPPYEEGKDYFLLIKEAKSGRTIQQIKLTSDELRLQMEFRFSPDSKYVVGFGGEIAASAPNTWGGTAQVWEVSSGKKYLASEWERLVGFASFSPDSNFLAVGVDDSTTRVLQLNNQQEIIRIQHDASGAIDGRGSGGVAFSTDGKYLITRHSTLVPIDEDETAFQRGDPLYKAWLLRPEDQISEACKRLTRNLTVGEWQQYIGDEPYRKTCLNLE